MMAFGQEGIEKINGELLVGVRTKDALKAKVGEEIDTSFFEAKGHYYPPCAVTSLL